MEASPINYAHLVNNNRSSTLVHAALCPAGQSISFATGRAGAGERAHKVSTREVEIAKRPSTHGVPYGYARWCLGLRTTDYA